MLDINLIRNNLDQVKQKLLNKKVITKQLDTLQEIDIKYRKLLHEQQTLTASKNTISQEIGNIIKQDPNHKDISKLKQEVNNIKILIDEINANLEIQSTSLKNIVESLPNICDDSVPIGSDENSNVVVKTFSTPRDFNFPPLPNWELARKMNLYLADIATKITGARFITYFDQGAKLYRALQQLTLDMNIKGNYIEVLPQVIVNSDSLMASGQLPKFKEDLFKLEDSNYYLSPTAEVQLTSIYRNCLLELDALPIKFTANTACFRSEAGSAGRDTRGAFRLHQFHKTELMCYAHPNNSYDVLENMVTQAESILEALKLPYRRVILCTGDTGFSSAKTYDIEVWLPSYNNYKEISSCSNCTDFQARRAKIRFKDIDGTNKFVHTLNGSSLAIDRLWIAVVENYQTKDGCIEIPEVLRPYMQQQKQICPK